MRFIAVVLSTLLLPLINSTIAFNTTKPGACCSEMIFVLFLGRSRVCKMTRVLSQINSVVIQCYETIDYITM